jgi:uncharacterized membrane protein
VQKDTHPGTLILLGQISFFFFLSASIALHPGFVFKSNEGGVSNYGIHLRTAAPYTLAFGLCAYFSLRAASLYPRGERSTRDLRRLLEVYGALVLLTLASTYVYKMGPGFKQLHIAVGVATITFELLASAWMFHRSKSSWDLGFLVVQATGCLLAGLTLLGALHVLFLGQALADLGFALLLVHTGLSTPLTGRGSVPGDPPTA